MGFEEIEREAVERYVEESVITPDDRNYSVYQEIKDLIDTKLEKVEEDEVEKYVRARAGAYRNETASDSKSKTQGLFSGALLEKAFESNDTVSINARGASFDHLFSNVSNIGKLFLKNIKGDRVLERACSKGGKAEGIYVLDGRGDWMLSGGFREGGEAEEVMIKSVYGKKTATYLGYESEKIDRLLLSDIYGDFTGIWLGNGMSEEGITVAENLYGQGQLEYSDLSDSEGFYTGEEINKNFRDVLLGEQYSLEEVLTYFDGVFDGLTENHY